MGRPSRGSIVRGSRGDNVMALQEQLIAAGHKIEADGNFGPKTEAALRSYQKANGYQQNGYVEPALAKKMGLDLTTGGESKSAAVATSKAGSDLVLPGEAKLWYNSDTDEWIVVYTIGAIEQADGTKTDPIFTSWTVESDEDLEAVVGPDATATAAKTLTSKELTDMGVVNFGGVDEFRDFEHIEGNPFDSWVEDMATLAEVQPWILDEEWHQLAVMAVMERDDAQISVAELQGTDWWQSHSETERRWMEMVNADPSTAEQWRADSRANTIERIRNAGVSNITGEVANWMADRVTTGAWTADQFTNQLEGMSDPYSGIKIDKDLATKMTEEKFTPDTTAEKQNTVRALLNKWLGPVYGDWTEEQIAEKAGSLRQDPDGEAEFIEALKDQRVAVIPGNENRNVSYQDLAEPWKRFGQQSWGQEMNETDPLFQTMVKNNDAQANGRLLNYEGMKRDVGKVVTDTRSAINDAFGGAVR